MSSSIRNSSLMGRRVPLTTSTTGSGTPTSSGRPSLDYYQNSNLSIITNSNDDNNNETFAISNSNSSRSSIATSKLNRAALREYYNLKGGGGGLADSSRTTAATTATTSTTTTTDKADDLTLITETNSVVSSIPDYNMPYETSELDQPDFDVEAFVNRVLGEQTLIELLTTYNSLLGEIRALDSEQKALVYDNYSKLITATETIARMRGCVESGEPITGTLSVVIDNIFSKAEELKKKIDRVSGTIVEKQKAEEKMGKIRARNVALRVLDTPEKVRNLVKEGNQEEAKKVWEEVRLILMKWKDKEVGGPDVVDCLEDGERALRGEPPTEKSWVIIRDKRIHAQR